MADAVAGEVTGVMTRSQVDVPHVSDGIVEAVGIDYALGGGRKVVVQGIDRLLGVQPPVTKKVADKLFLLGVPR